MSGGNFDLKGASQTVVGLAGTAGNILSGVAGNATLNVNGGGSFNGVITNGTGVVNLVKGGTGTLTLANVNNYTGSTTITGGELLITNANAIDSGATSITLNGGTFGVGVRRHDR